MADVLFVGGTGQISLNCVEAAVIAGHRVSIYNRSETPAALPDGVKVIVGDLEDTERYSAVAHNNYDVVCQFVAYTPAQVQRDLDIFAGRVSQYVFISSASAYQKPTTRFRITETVPLHNPFWRYSQLKADCEQVIRQQTAVPYTIVRPSHTTRTRLPTALSEGDQVASRMLRGLPVVVPGDGTSLWPLTRSEDFAIAFVRLLGNSAALGQDFHITTDHAFPWNDIYDAIARGVGARADLVHVATDTLIRYQPDWEGPLRGDRIYSLLFDNSKVKAVVGEFTCETNLDRVLASASAACLQRLGTGKLPAAPLDPLFDRIIAEQRALAA